MLEPDTRHLLTDALRPPASFHLDIAVATTYSLDLTSLILAPLAMAAHDAASRSAEEEPDPIALLESVRRYARRTTVFCQAGAIHVPSQYRPVLAFAEDSVVQVVPRTACRIFHPKIWVLRFADAEGETLHRFLCLSRNLTMDKSWDTILRMEQSVDQSGADPAPIADFLDDLVDLATTPLEKSRRDQLRNLSESLRTIALEVPPPFSAAQLWPLGTASGREWPFPDEANRMAVISPFLDTAFLGRLPHPPRSQLISRGESFDRLGGGAIPAAFSTWVLQRAAETDDPDEEDSSSALEVSSGLHAKTFVWDVGRVAHVLTGSANATGAAFGGNVEFSVLLTGPSSSCGTEPLLADSAHDKKGSDSPGLTRLLQPYEIQSPDAQPDPAYACEREIEFFHAALAVSDVRLDATPEGNDYALKITVPDVTAPQAARTTARPLGRTGHGLSLDGELLWHGIAERSLSPFVVFETTISGEGVSVTRACVVKGTLSGDPETRQRTILRGLLSNERDLLRYLALLLGDPSFDTLISKLQDEVVDERHATRHLSTSRRDDLVVFEPLLRAAARRDGSLKRVDSLFREIGDADGSVPHLSQEFMALWSIVWAATKELQR